MPTANATRTVGAFKKEKEMKRGYRTKTSQKVTHPSTTLAQARLTTNEMRKIDAVKKEKTTGKGCNTRTSQEVTHHSATLAQARLIAEF